MTMELEDSNNINRVERRVRPQSIDVHPTEKAIIVNYELEASVIDDLGDTMLEQSRECQKIIRLKTLNENTDVNGLANEIIEKSNLISPSKFKELITILNYLRNRKNSSHRPLTAFSDKFKMISDNSDLEMKLNESQNATINKLDEYIELLYEDLVDKIKASSLILQLTRTTDNLIELSSNETLICALARVLREDGKKSLELAINIVYIFASFSNYSQFHTSISQFKVGSICFDLVECELVREESWLRELNEKRLLVDSQYNLKSEPDFEKSFKKYQLLVKKQNNFLRISYFLLLNLSEDSKVEIKMIKRGIIALLVKALERDSQDLLETVVRFLKKLSIYLENKNQMKDLSIIEKLAPLLSMNHEKLVSNTLLLLHNLVFDLQLRTIMIKIGLIPKLIAFIAKNRYTETILTILYQVSREDKWKSLFSYSNECINLIISKLFDENSSYYKQSIALAINLAINQRNAQLMCDRENFSKLFDKLFSTNDPLLLKLMRNLSHHDDPIKMLFLDYHEQLVQLMVSTDNEDIVVECLPILANLTMNQINWYQLLTKYSLLEWIKERLKPGSSYEDDIILQLVIFIGTAVNQKQCALYLINNDLIKLLIDLLNANQDDDEIVTQIIYSFHILIKHSDNRERILKSSQVASYLIDLMHDRNKEIKRVCNSALDVIAEYDVHWASKIKVEKFCAHNKQWLEMIQSQNFEDDPNNDLYTSVMEDSILYPALLLKTDLLNDSSSDNQSVDESVYLSLQGVSIANDNSPVQYHSNHIPILNHSHTNSANTSANKRPQTGYKKRCV